MLNPSSTDQWTDEKANRGLPSRIGLHSCCIVSGTSFAATPAILSLTVCSHEHACTACQKLCTYGTGVNFQYRDPERGFDRGKVKGVVAKLVRLQDPATTTALEVAAGGKLYQVHPFTVTIIVSDYLF